MKKIKEVIVVEGLHDQQRLQACFDCECIVTHGLGINSQTLSLIKAVNQTRGIIVLTDDDTPGRKIRSQIQAACGQVAHAYVDKKDSKTAKKVGIEHASCETLAMALSQAKLYDDHQQSLSFEQYLACGLMNQPKQRAKLLQYYQLPPMNNKRLFKTLNQLGVNQEKVRQILDADSGE